MKLIEINNRNEGQRVDKFLLKLLPGMSKSLCYKMMRKKNITINNKKIKGNEILKDGDALKVFFSDETYEKLSVPRSETQQSNVVPSLEVVFEDDELLVVNKGVGIFSQKDPKGISITEQIEAYYKANNIQLEVGVKVGVSNRLDTNTTGIILSGKTLPMIQSLNVCIKEHRMTKLYRTIVVGELTEPLVLKGYLTKDYTLNKVSLKNIDKEGIIETKIIPIRYEEGFTECEINLITGKTHQIRAHLAAINHPIIGDRKYGNEKVNERFSKAYGLTYQLLHSYQYTFIDSKDNKHIEKYKEPFIAPLSKQYNRIASDLFSC